MELFSETIKQKQYVNATTTTTIVRPYGHYCSTKIFNELQVWNQQKRVVSFNIVNDNVIVKKDSSSHIGNMNFDSNVTHFKESFIKFKETVGSVSLHYPDWIIRVHTFDVSSEDMQRLVQIDPSRIEIVECYSASPIGNTLGTKAASRLLPYDDLSVNAFISRDIDQPVTPTETFPLANGLLQTFVSTR